MSGVDEIKAVVPGMPGGATRGYFRVLLYTARGACYVGGNYERHPVSVHGVKGGRKRVVVEGLAGADLAARVTDVIQPPHD
jgi:hypothetical protein